MARTYRDGLILLARDNQVLEADSNARAIIKADLGLRLIGDRLRSFGRHPEDHNDAMQSFLNGECEEDLPFVIRSGSNSYIVMHRYPVTAELSVGQLGASHVVRVVIVDLSLPPSTILLARMFGLTRSEEAVVSALTAASNASEAARRLNLSRETVKTHLTSIYAKTGTSSLTQLMLLTGKLVYRT